MEMSQGNTLYNYVKQTQTFYIKMENRKAGQVLSCGLVTHVCKKAVHMHVNGKMRPAETIPGMEGGGNKGE
jgi:hypothetical protein